MNDYKPQTPKAAKWDQRYLDLADFVSTWSEDRNTKVGCVLVRDNRILSLGYNGLPVGVRETDERMQRPEKYLWTVHAEINAVTACALAGTSTKGSTAYIPVGLPCPDCARTLIQAGIQAVIYRKGFDPKNWSDEYREKFARSEQMLEEADVFMLEA